MNLLILPHIKIQNANALSSPFTIGFPAMTAWLGFTHALERKLNMAGFDELMLHSTAVISHQCDLQTYKGREDFVHSIVGTGNPLNKDGKRSAFIEEARCHLEVSLVIEYEGIDEAKQSKLTETVNNLVSAMKLAGGDVLELSMPMIKNLNENDEQETTRLLGQLMPGYVLIERRELMIDEMQQGKDGLDAILNYLTVNHFCVETEDKQISWHSQRKAAGWFVPIATGFQGISELGLAKNQRDPDTPHRFAESIITLGEFIMANKIKHIDDMLWQYLPDPENDLYLCQPKNNVEEY